MLPDYTYYRPAAPEEELSAYFAQRLGLVRVDPETPFSLRSNRWWVRVSDPDEDWAEEAARIGLLPEQMVMVVFEPMKGLSTEEFFQADVDLFSAIIDQLNDTPDITGLLQHGDITVLIERHAGGPTLLDAKLADPEEYNYDNHLASVLPRGVLTDLVDFE